MAGRDVKIMPLCDANVIVAEEFSLSLRLFSPAVLFHSLCKWQKEIQEM
jgi:hypothetical protein